MSSVGCTVIQMASGKRPWSQQFQEVVALFHIGTTNSHPPIPEHLSRRGKDFLLECLQREPTLRPSATELLKHPFVLTCEIQGGFKMDLRTYNNNNNKQLMVTCSSSGQIGEIRNSDL